MENRTRSQDREQGLAAVLERLGPGAHLCLCYQRSEERFAAVVPYLRIGLARHEQCVYVADDETASDEGLLKAMRAAGVDVGAALRSGALSTVRCSETYLAGPRFDPDLMLAWLEERVRAARAAGYSGVRTAGESAAALACHPDGKRFAEYEARLNTFLLARPALSLCQYDRSRFPAAFVREILATHPWVLAGGELCENPYFVPPERYLSPDRQEQEVDWVLQTMHRLHLALDALRASEREAREATRLRDEFLSVASHELYTPMASLMLSLETLAGSVPSEQHLDDASVRRLLDVLLRQGRRLVKLTSDLLSVSRIEVGRLSLDLEDVDLVELVHDIVERFAVELSRSGSSVSVRGGAPVLGEWDRSRLDQVVTNLFSNAIKFGEGRPIEIAIGAEHGIARLTVTDHGIGIDPASLGTIFDRFQRAVSAEHYGGLGLGLYVSRRVLEAHGGSIRVESTQGAGSTFTVELPSRGPAR